MTLTPLHVPRRRPARDLAAAEVLAQQLIGDVAAVGGVHRAPGQPVVRGASKR
ncbi:hypothetical protein [Micromonospora sp. CB01531]|uniref:hypothetical protein n=1 Tax=Micromonospora sp. CB01531 TaxID=1718947 RepID=UPI000AD60455|nr:hypothetical protein [Micromonospora sp. CB01531]